MSWKTGSVFFRDGTVGEMELAPFPRFQVVRVLNVRDVERSIRLGLCKKLPKVGVNLVEVELFQLKTDDGVIRGYAAIEVGHPGVQPVVFVRGQ